MAYVRPSLSRETHVSSIWFIVSSSWLQNGQESWCSSPLLANMSNVQHLLQRANHENIRHCKGALDFHEKSAVGTTSRPANLDAYADRTENTPPLSQDHVATSGMSSCSSMQLILVHSRRYFLIVSICRSGPISLAHALPSMASATVRARLSLGGIPA